MSAAPLSEPLKTRHVYASSLAINRIRLLVHLGVEAQERAHKQPVDLDLVFYFSSLPEGNLKDEGDYLCYGDISGRIRQMSESREFRLIEYLGMEVCRCVREWLQGKPGGDDIKISLCITKCNLPMDYVLGGASYRYSDLPPFSWVPPW